MAFLLLVTNIWLWPCFKESHQFPLTVPFSHVAFLSQHLFVCKGLRDVSSFRLLASRMKVKNIFQKCGNRNTGWTGFLKSCLFILPSVQVSTKKERRLWFFDYGIEGLTVHKGTNVSRSVMLQSCISLEGRIVPAQASPRLRIRINTRSFSCCVVRITFVFKACLQTQ